MKSRLTSMKAQNHAHLLPDKQFLAVPIIFVSRANQTLFGGEIEAIEFVNNSIFSHSAASAKRRKNLPLPCSRTLKYIALQSVNADRAHFQLNSIESWAPGDPEKVCKGGCKKAEFACTQGNAEREEKCSKWTGLSASYCVDWQKTHVGIIRVKSCAGFALRPEVAGKRNTGVMEQRSNSIEKERRSFYSLSSSKRIWFLAKS